MSDRKMPRYPMYIPSKGRADHCYTADLFIEDDVPFRLVVEKQDFDAYADRYGADRLLQLPFENKGLVAARNWIRTHAEDEGHDRHWQFDDNIRAMRRVVKQKRLYCASGVALAVCEDFTDRYTNVAISGFQYTMFVPTDGRKLTPFMTNQHVYSASLINHAMPYRWRRAYNDDTDICLQALAGGWCTILLNAFTVDKIRTMTLKGGNTDDLYGPEYDGRLRMARSLERDWPGVVTVNRRFGRPQHIVKHAWRKFDTKLIRRDDVEVPDEPDEYGMKITAVDEVKSQRLQKIVDEYS